VDFHDPVHAAQPEDAAHSATSTLDLQPPPALVPPVDVDHRVEARRVHERQARQVEDHVTMARLDRAPGARRQHGCGGDIHFAVRSDDQSVIAGDDLHREL